MSMVTVSRRTGRTYCWRRRRDPKLHVPRALRIVAGLALSLFFVACDDSSGTSHSSSPGTVADIDCSVRIGLTNDSAFSNLDVEIDYSHAPGTFVGLGAEVACTRVTDRLAVYVSNWNCGPEEGCYGDEQPVLYLQGISDHDVAGPMDLARCRFIGSAPPEPRDFDFSIVDVTDEAFGPVIPPPVLAITGVDCRDAGATTTTTTLADPCAEVQCEDGTACVGGDCLPTASYDVDFGVDNDADFGALQFDVVYDCRDGTFDGLVGNVACVVNPALNAWGGFNNRACDPMSDMARLTAGIVTGSSKIDGPMLVASCRYTSTTGEPPSTDAFGITVVDASDPSLTPIPDAAVSVQGIRAVAP